MIKIGILTFQRAHNYGAVLQAYALMETLKNKGYNTEIIDYWPKYRDGQYNLLSFRNKSTKNNNTSIFSKAKDAAKKIAGFPYKFIKYLKFRSFIKDRLKIKNTSYHSGTDIPDKYDVIICGSDQIWRYDFLGSGGFDEVYFAKYPLVTKAIKISYAASMGDKDLDEDATEIFSGLIQNFDSISVREDSLQETVKLFALTLPVKVLDPVFLLPNSEWRKMIKGNANKKKYLLFYQLLHSDEANKLAKKIAKERQLEIIEIRGEIGKPILFGIKKLKNTAGPIDFITLIAHADYVVSTSYHGVVFSIIFQKPFVALGFQNKSYRIKSLLKSFGIDKCFIEKDSNSYPPSINYKHVNEKLEEMKKFSMSFLELSIKKEN